MRRYLAEEIPERISTASRYRCWLKNHVEPKWRDYAQIVSWMSWRSSFLYDEAVIAVAAFLFCQFPSMVVGSLPTTLPFVTVVEVTFRYDFNMPAQRVAVSRLLDID